MASTGSVMGGMASQLPSYPDRSTGMIEGVRDTLSGIVGNLTHLNQRLGTMNDRAFGAVPRPVSNSKGENSPPAGQIPQINALLQTIDDQMKAAHSTLDSLERITGA